MIFSQSTEVHLQAQEKTLQELAEQLKNQEQEVKLARARNDAAQAVHKEAVLKYAAIVKVADPPPEVQK